MTIAETLRQRKGLMTVREVAEALACHKDTIYGWVAEGKLPHLRVGSRLKFDGAVVADWLEKRSM